MTLMTHEPIIVAARIHGTYGANGFADRLLGLFAGPAIDWTALLAVPLKYGGARATERESFSIAAGGFILSTAFWAAFAPILSTLLRRCRQYWQRRHMARLRP